MDKSIIYLPATELAQISHDCDEAERKVFGMTVREVQNNMILTAEDKYAHVAEYCNGRLD